MQEIKSSMVFKEIKSSMVFKGYNSGTFLSDKDRRISYGSRSFFFLMKETGTSVVLEG